jgi:hypothetical protein
VGRSRRKSDRRRGNGKKGRRERRERREGGRRERG